MARPRKREASAKEMVKGPIGMVYTTDEAAALLRISQKTVTRAIAAKKLIAKKVGRAWSIREEDLQAYYQSLPSNVN
jgi:excisionase family DNA binding protein